MRHEISCPISSHQRYLAIERINPFNGNSVLLLFQILRNFECCKEYSWQKKMYSRSFTLYYVTNGTSYREFIKDINVFVDKARNIAYISCNFNWSFCSNIYTSKEFYLLPRLIVVLKYFTLFKISTRETICIFMQPICRLWLLNHILVCLFFFRNI